MSENVQKGWLKSRDGDKFAPITLVENVYTRNNQPYDERVREYISALSSNNSTTLATIGAQAQANAESIKTLQQSIIDTNEKFDGELANIDTSDADTLYIIDGSNQVIAYVDKDGVHSVDMILKSGKSLTSALDDIGGLKSSATTLGSRIDTLEDSLSNIKANGDANDTLYIIDNAEQVIAYINKDGVHSINFLTDDTINYRELVDKANQNESDIDDLVAADKGLSAQIAGLAARLLVIENAIKPDEYTDTFYIVDNNNQVIFYANKNGIHSTNVHVDDARDYLTLDQTVTDIIRDIGDLQEADKDLDGRLDAEEAATTAHNTRLNDLEAKTANQSLDYSNTLYIVDANDRTVAYFNDTGLHVINVFSGASGETQYDLNVSLEEIYKGQDTLSDRIDAEEEARKKRDNEINAKTETNKTELQAIANVLGYTDTGDIFYFIDNSNNVIAYIDNNGLHVVNVLVGATVGENKTEEIYALYEQLTKLIADSAQHTKDIGNNAEEIKALKAKDETLGAKDDELDGRVQVLEAKVENVSNVMDFVGSFTELPSVNDYQNGDVCVVGNKEYILWEDPKTKVKTWIEFGDTTEEAAVILKLQNIVGDPESTNNSTTSHESRLDALDSLTNSHTSSLNELSAAIGWTNSDSLYIIDKDGNTIAYFDKNGLTVTNVTVKDITSTTEVVKNAKDQMVYLKKGDSLSISWSIPL